MRSFSLPAACVALCTFLTCQSHAGDSVWSGANSTNWGMNPNWVGNARPTATDNAVFNSGFTNQPNLTSNSSVGGIWMTNGVAQNVTITASSPSVLQISGNTINGTAGLGILVDNASAFSLAISAPIRLAGAQTWRNNSGNLLTIGSVDLFNNALTVDGTGNTAITDVINNSGSVTKNGTGTLILSGANVFIGTTTINAGAVNVQSSSALGLTFAGGTTVNSGGALQLQGNVTVNAEPLSLNGSGTASTGALRNISGNNTYTGPITLAGASTIGSDAGLLTLSGTVNNGGFATTFTGSGSTTASGVISGTGSLTKAGSGLLSLNGSNTYSGGTTINAGTVAINSGSSLGAAGGGLTINAGTLEVTNGFATNRSTTLGSTSSTIQVDTGQTFAVNGTVGGGGTLNKTGAGTLVLNANNSYSGTVINGGTISISADNNLGSNGAKPTINGGTLEITNSFTTNRQFTIGDPLSAFQVDAGVSFTVKQNISGSGSLNKTGAGTLILGGNHLGYTGATNILDGTVQITKQGQHLPNSTALTISGGTLDLLTFDESVGQITLQSGSIIGTGRGQISGTSFNMQSGSVSAILAGSGTLTKTTAGTVILTGVNTYTGGTFINAGNLAINSPSALGASSANTTINGGALELLSNNNVVTNRAFSLGDPNATFQVDTGSTLNITSVINNATTPGSLTKTGGGTLILSAAGANTYGGVGQTTSINDGVLQVARDNLLGSASNTISFNGAGLGTLRIGGPGFTTGRSVIVNSTGTVDTNNNNASITGVISGSGVFTKTGAGTLTLTGLNTYSGGTSIIGGNNSILSVSNSANLGTGAVTISGGSVLQTTATMSLPGGLNLGAIGGNAQPDGKAVSGILNVAAGTTLTETAGGVITGGRLMKDGTGTLDLLGTNTYSGGTYLHNGTIIVHNASSLGVQSNPADPFSSALTIDNGATLRVANSFVGYPGRGILIGTGGGIFDIAAGVTQFNNGPIANVSGQTGGFTKTGAGTMGLGGTNSFVGNVNVNAGVLSISRDANLGAAANQLFLTGGTTLRVEDGLDNFGATPATPVLATFTTNRQFNLGAGNDTVEVKNFADTNPSFGVGGAPARPSSHLNTVTMSGLVTGAGTLVKEGDGKVVLSNASNNYSGGTVVNGGTLSINNSAALGLNTTGLAINNNATFQATGSFSTSRNITVGTTTGPVGGIIDVTGANNFTALGVISGAGSLGKTGTGTLTLRGTNTFTGGLNINGGTVSANSNAALGALTPSAGSGLYAVHIANGGTLQTTFNSVGDNRQLDLASGVSTLDVTAGTTYQRGALVYGSGGFVKTGSGTEILTNANTYTGPTTVNGGILQVNNSSGSGTGSGNVTVNSGGTLSGLPATGFASAGTVSGVVTVNSGGNVLARSGTTFTFGGLTLNAGSTTQFNLASPTAINVINITTADALSLAGASTVNIANAGGLAAGTYHLFDYNGAALSSIANLSLGSMPGGNLLFSLSNNQANTSIDLIVSSIDNQWANDASGNWSVPSNWTSNVPPNAAGAAANFLGLINQPRTATVDGAYTVGTITFDNVNTYTVADDGVAGHGLTMNNGGTAGISVLTGSHIITAPITLANDLNIFADTGTGLTLGGSIGETGGSRAVVLTGPGSVTLSGTTANTYTGLTTVSSGTLNLNKTSGVDAIGSGGLEIDPGSITNLLASNQISDLASLMVDGTFNIGANSDIVGSLAGGGSVVTATGGTLTIGGPNGLSSQFDGVISGGGSIAKSGNGTLTLTGANTFGGAGQTVTINAGQLEWNSDANLGNAANSITFNGGALVFASGFATARSIVLNGVGTIDTNNNAAQIDGTISGAGSLAKIGDGILTLTGTNTYSGGTSISGGNGSILSVSSLSNLGSGSLTLSGGAVLATTSTMSLPNAINLGVTGGSNQPDGNAVSGIINVTSGTTLTEGAGSVISGGRLMKDGAGTLELFGANTYNGGTYLHNGVLVVSNSASLGTQANLADPFSSALTIDNAATLRFVAAYNGYPGRGFLIGSGGAVFDNSGITNFLNGPIANVSGQGGGFTKTGDGTIGLGGTNTFDGDVTIAGGVLSVSRDENLGSSSNQIYINNGATLRVEDGLDNYGASPGSPVLATFSTSRQINLVSGNDTIEVKDFADTNSSFGAGGAPVAPGSHVNTLTIDGLLTGAGTLVKAGDGTLVLTNTSNNYGGGTVINNGTLSIDDSSELGLNSTGLTINNDAIYQATGSVDSSRTVTLGGTGGPATVGGGTFDVLAGLLESQSGIVQGSGSLSKTGAGTLQLTGSNTYSGGSYLNGGTVQIDTDASLGAASGTVSIGNATLEVLGDVQTSRSVTVTDAASTIQVDGNATYGMNGAIGGIGSVVKTGTGTLNLFGTNTYSGTTTINSGTVAINNASSLGSGISAVTIGAGVLNATSTVASNHSLILSDATSTVQVDPGQTFTNNGTLSGSGSLTKTGTGTFVAAGDGTFSGSTRIAAGTVVAAAGAGSAFGSTISLSIEMNASFILGANNQINNAALITLAGGSFLSGGFSEGSASAAGMGLLTLTGNSLVDFTGGAGTLSFADFTPGSSVLTVNNWTGTVNTIGDATTDRLIFNTDPTAYLSQFIFTGYDGAVVLDLGNGFYEVTPLAIPVPELDPALIVALLCGALIGFKHARIVIRGLHSGRRPLP
ncbi:MAG: beta strand repeat-containing protein [Chthoniobacterales bacterium]